MTTEKAIRQAVDRLMPALTLVQPYDAKASVFDSIRSSKNGNRYTLSEKCEELLALGAQKLEAVVDNYPTEALRRHVCETLLATKDLLATGSDAAAELKTGLAELLLRLRTLKRWECAHIVRGISSPIPEFGVGRTTFTVADENWFLTWGRRFATGHITTTTTGPVDKDWMRSASSLLHQVVGTVHVSAADEVHANHLSRLAVEESLNLLCYAQLIIGFPDEPAPEIGLAANVNGDLWYRESVYACLDGGGLGNSSEGGGTLGVLPAYCENAAGWSKLNTLLCKDHNDRNDLDTRLTKAMVWCGEAMRTRSSAVRMVSLVTAAEALLIRPHETTGKKRKLASRIAFFPPSPISGNSVDAVAVEDLYRVRSECVHGGLTSVSSQCIRRGVLMLAQTINGILEDPRIAGAKSVDDLVARIESIQPSVAT